MRRSVLRSDIEKRRAFIDRGRKPIVRHTPMRRSNPARKRRRFEAAYLSPAYVAFIRWQGCIVPGCNERPIHACHRVSRARGGTWRDLFGACWKHHALQHSIGIRAFEGLFNLDLAAACDRLVLAWKVYTK